MLEFQEGFFEQEIRDGFYIDTTMKTVWAAELEVLQKVAEVCDKYNLTWYAACGSLLGAIRHEGFVPWDDDMDIWMLRKDYNKLMEVLPKELPEHYRVRSPLTEEGYDQYHTCVNSGSGVSIAPNWLEEFHGCPFTVGLDIFPLDYLTRNEGERETQKSLFLLAGRMAQMAKETNRGENTEEADEESREAIEKTKEEILEGIQYLQERWNLKINKQLVEDEQWYEASSELWKWANYIAMMYGEEDGDYLVEYVDYTRWETKKFKKEWFDEVYSATFENFMLPIPAGYHEVLKTLYSIEYMSYYRKIGQHEYPYYARQLKQLKEYVKDVQSRAGEAGLVNIEDMEVVKDSVEIPAEWLPIVTRKDGSRKKLVLSANDPAVYMAYGEEALDKLENTLAQFEEAQEDVTLWWRPMPVMAKLLHTVSANLAERYVSILDAYKNAGWGICDETDNTDRAVANCDIYYGEMNAIIQPFQNAGKTVIVAHMGDVDYKKNNEERIKEYKAFPNFTDFVEVDGTRYFLNAIYNALMVLDEENVIIKEFIPLEREKHSISPLHCVCVENQGRICLLPIGAGNVQVYHTATGVQKSFRLEETRNAPHISWGSFTGSGNTYLLPCHHTQHLWRWNVEEDSFEKEDWWKLPTEGNHLKHGSLNEECFYTLQVNSNQLYITNIDQKIVEKYTLPDAEVSGIQYDGQNFWYINKGSKDIVCWNKEQGVIDRYEIQQEIQGEENFLKGYLEIYLADNKLFLISGDSKSLYVLDKENRNIQYLSTIDLGSWNYKWYDMRPYLKQAGDCLLITREAVDKLQVLRLKTMNMEQHNEKMSLNKEAKEFRQNILMNFGMLLYEDGELIDLETMLCCCKGQS